MNMVNINRPEFDEHFRLGDAIEYFEGESR